MFGKILWFSFCYPFSIPTLSYSNFLSDRLKSFIPSGFHWHPLTRLVLLFPECNFSKCQFPRMTLYPNEPFLRKVFSTNNCHNFLHFMVVKEPVIGYAPSLVGIRGKVAQTLHHLMVFRRSLTMSKGVRGGGGQSESKSVHKGLRGTNIAFQGRLLHFSGKKDMQDSNRA